MMEVVWLLFHSKVIFKGPVGPKYFKGILPNDSAVARWASLKKKVSGHTIQSIFSVSLVFLNIKYMSKMEENTFIHSKHIFSYLTLSLFPTQFHMFHASVRIRKVNCHEDEGKQI